MFSVHRAHAIGCELRPMPIAVTWSGRALAPRSTSIESAPAYAVFATPMTGTCRAW
jgi:hypothetical protein